MGADLNTSDFKRIFISELKMHARAIHGSFFRHFSFAFLKSSAIEAIGSSSPSRIRRPDRLQMNFSIAIFAVWSCKASQANRFSELVDLLWAGINTKIGQTRDLN